jgi:uncharacterized membrane protein
MRVVRGRPLSFLCCGRCAHSMARAQRQPRARSEILSDPRMDAPAGGDALRRAHALHEIAARRGLVCKAQVEFNGALGYKALRRS